MRLFVGEILDSANGQLNKEVSRQNGNKSPAIKPAYRQSNPANAQAIARSKSRNSPIP